MKNDNLLTCEIVHRLRGRIRIKSKAFKYVGNSLKSEIERQLLQVRYIKSVEISLITGTILIYFEDVSLSDQNLINLIQNTLNSHIFEICKNEKIPEVNELLRSCCLEHLHWYRGPDLNRHVHTDIRF